MATSNGVHVIVGGLGHLGRAMQRTLLAHGKEVRVIDRVVSHDAVASRLVHPTAVDYVACSIGDDHDASSKLQEALKNAETVYSMVTPDVLKSSAADMKRTNVGGVQQLMDVCQEVGVPKLLHASSMAVTNQLLEHAEENEETPLPDWDTYRIAYDITKRQGEDIVRNANDSDNSSNFQTCSLRLGSILGGPGDYLTRSFLETPGRVSIPTGDAKIDWISARDISVAFFKASDKLDASRSTIAGSALFVTKCRTNQSSSSGAILQAFCHEFEWKPIIVPPFIQSTLATGARAYQGIKGILVTPTEDNTKGMPFHLTLETGRYELTFDNSLARKLLDFEPEETWQDAVSRIAGEIREELPHLFPK
jgi:nucleoside-diphosphate-sugar epimerase